jgi:hypothetical protein
MSFARRYNRKLWMAKIKGRRILGGCSDYPLTEDMPWVRLRRM